MPGKTNAVSGGGTSTISIGCTQLTAIKPNQTIVVNDVITKIRAGLQTLANNGVKFYGLKYTQDPENISWVEYTYDNLPITFNVSSESVVTLILGVDSSLGPITSAVVESSGILSFKIEYSTEFDASKIELISGDTSTNKLYLIISSGKDITQEGTTTVIPSAPSISLWYAD